MLLTTAVLLVSVLMTGCTSLTEPKNSTPSGTDALTESDGFGVYIKLERDDTSSIALRGFRCLEYAYPWLVGAGETKPDSRLAVQHRERCEWKTERNRLVSLAFQRWCR